jgi:AcrR family transcriptional regulator
MVIPHPLSWAELSADAKRERLLDAARELFAREGLGASMPAVAAAAGAGVGSVYRQFADKDDLIAALVLQRLDEFQQQLEAAAPTSDAWADFTAMVWRGIEGRDGCDDVLTQAIAATSDRPDVSAARALVADAIDLVMDRARVQGTLRADAGVQDVRLLFAAVRGADGYAAGGGRRIAQLLIDGLRAR